MTYSSNSLTGKVLLVLVLVMGCLFGVSLRKPTDSRSALIKAGFRDYEESVRQLNKTGNDFRLGLCGAETLRQAVEQTRYSYKRIEFLVEYYYPAFAEDHLNGAPLLHIEWHDTRPYVIPPEGLQVLDERIFSDSVTADRAEISNLCQQLHNQTMILMGGLNDLTVPDRDLIAAVRMELIRVLTLGITGFDTPGSLNGLAESAVAMKSMQEALNPLMESTDPLSATRINQYFNSGIRQLEQNPGFDSFDRLHFLKTSIDPLYRELGRLEPDFNTHTGLNPGASGIFSDDFLNPYFYTRLSREEDSPELRELGKTLFFDPTLSHDGKLSCASCHDPSPAFADGQKKSQSNRVGETLLRNSPTLLNSVYADRYFYDLRAFTLEQQAEHVIFNQSEFNTAYDEILAKLNADKAYRKRFKAALGSRRVDRDGFSKALASYVLSLRSFNSPFDRYVRGETDSLNALAIRGFNLFMGKAACGTCHFPPTFSGLVPPRYTKNESEILGVLKNPQAWMKEVDEDPGRVANLIYSEQSWIFERSFKTTTVRNTELTAPYFHNGAYASLEAVVNFYDMGGGSGFGLDVKNQTLPADRLNLSEEEKLALIAFLKSLTDTGPARAWPATERE